MEAEGAAGSAHHEEACVICIEAYSTRGDERVGWLPCRHVFHFKCIEEAAGHATRCPCCKQGFSAIIDTTARAAWAGPPVRVAGAAAAARLPTVSPDPPPGKAVNVVSTAFRYIYDASEFPDNREETACLRECLLRGGYGGRIDAESYEVQCDKCEA